MRTMILIALALATLACAKPEDRFAGASTALVVGAPTADAVATSAALPSVGDTEYAGDWQVRVHRVLPYERYATRTPSPRPQGKLVVIEFGARNLSQRTSNFSTNDFRLVAPDGREFAPTGQTGTIPGGFVAMQTVQPGLVTQNRVVFDVDPAVEECELRILGMRFHIALNEDGADE